MNTPVAGVAGDTWPRPLRSRSPATNAQVSDIVNVTAIASDNVGVVGVQFLVDGVNAGSRTRLLRTRLAWDTRRSRTARTR